jgi:alpha,alpha-trehalose phosphorylase
MRHQIRAVLFDLDGVVAFTDRYHYLAWKKLADEKGWAFDQEVNHRLRGIPRLASLQAILDHNRIDLPAAEKEALADRKNEYYKALLRGINKDDLYPGIVEFLRRLKATGVKLALCSSSRNAGMVLRKLGLRKWFDAVVTGADLTHAKPHPEIFLKAASALGVHPQYGLVFEDAASGVEAARAARMKCIGVGTAEQVPNAAERVTDYATIDLDAMLDTGRPGRPPAEEWAWSETAPVTSRAACWETDFALSNGLIGVRGAVEEDDPRSGGRDGAATLLNGIYGFEPYQHVVKFPGYPERKHAILRVCDWTGVTLRVDGETFSPYEGACSHYRRSLNLRAGRLERTIVWTSPAGRRVRIDAERLVSLPRRRIAAQRYRVTALDPCRLRFESVVRAPVKNPKFKAPQIEIADVAERDGALAMTARVTTAPLAAGMAFAHAWRGPAGAAEAGAAPRAAEGDAHRWTWEVDVPAGGAAELVKVAAFAMDVDPADGAAAALAADEARRARDDGFERLRAEQEAAWAAWWDAADVRIDGAPRDQQAVRFSLFHLRQSHPEDDRRSISANALTGDLYSGHVFWDTEMYLMPPFAYARPELQRSLLMYRHGLLDKARERARQMGGEGALFSWNSISGEECGVVYEAATAEYHIECAVACAIDRYVRSTGDRAFLHGPGAEILFETARFLSGRGAFIPARGGRFCLNVVCGPDEYGCGVNNNCYTNVLTRWHLRYALATHAGMRRACPGKLKALERRIGLRPEELARWRRAADRMYVPWNARRGIHEQDDSFLYLDPADMNLIPRNTDIRGQMHPLNLWRLQVAKQADVVLLMFVRSEEFTPAQKRANYAFYEPRTCHGSSLSAGIHSILAAEIGLEEPAGDYFRESAMMDLDDFKNNTAGGVHAAAMGATWMAVVNGFAGFRDESRGFRFAPRLPSSWSGYGFTLALAGRRVRVEVGPAGATYRLMSGPAIRFASGGRPVALTPARPERTMPLLPWAKPSRNPGRGSPSGMNARRPRGRRARAEMKP